MMQHKEKTSKFKKSTVKRLMKYVTGTYKLRFTCVLLFILISSAAGVAGSLFLEILINDYIAPLLGIQNPVFTSLLGALGIMAISRLPAGYNTMISGDGSSLSQGQRQLDRL